jgi:hypothetical protein
MSQSNDISRSEDVFPDCFGNLEIVFPLADDGLRHTPAPCLQCPYKTECLRTGLTGDDGLKVREEKLDRSYDSGMIGFMERWSQKKALERRKKNQRTFLARWRLSKSDAREPD